VKGSRDLLFKSLGPLHISGTVQARNFKFSTQIATTGSYERKFKLGQRRLWLTLSFLIFTVAPWKLYSDRQNQWCFLNVLWYENWPKIRNKTANINVKKIALYTNVNGDIVSYTSKTAKIKIDRIFIRLDKTLECDGRTDRQTHEEICRDYYSGLHCKQCERAVNMKMKVFI